VEEDRISEIQCPNCGAIGILHGLFGDEPAIREISGWNHCVMCGYDWKEEGMKDSYSVN